VSVRSEGAAGSVGSSGGQLVIVRNKTTLKPIKPKIFIITFKSVPPNIF
jgi:hypothetical protein